LLSTTTFDLLAWAAIAFLAVRAVRIPDDRLWFATGAVLGIALLNKPLVAFLAVALAVGLALAGPRRVFRSPWAWAGALLAVAVWAPWLIWQAGQGWPQLEVASAIAEGGSTTSAPRLLFLPMQLVLVSPFLAPVWIAGLAGLLCSKRLRPFRFVGIAWALLAATFLIAGGKPYYLAGLFPVLLAAGAVYADRWLGAGRRGRGAVLVSAFVASAVISGFIALPLLPATHLGPVLAANDDVGETVGWSDLAATVARVAREGPGAPANPVIFTENYGEAGAVARDGPALGLGPAYSGHNGFADWGPPPDVAAPVILVGFGEGSATSRLFDHCRQVAEVRNGAGVENAEWGRPVHLCEGPSRPWPELWPRLRHLG
jgi:hypothetical protein